MKYIHYLCWKHTDCCFSFLRFIGLSICEASHIFLRGLLTRWISAYLSWKSAYRIHYKFNWSVVPQTKYLGHEGMLLYPLHPAYSLWSSSAFQPLIFSSYITNVCGFEDHLIYHVKGLTKDEKQSKSGVSTCITSNQKFVCNQSSEKRLHVLHCQLTIPPSFLTNLSTKVVAEPLTIYCPDISAKWWFMRNKFCGSLQGLQMVQYGHPDATSNKIKHQCQMFHPPPMGGLLASCPQNGWSKILIPSKETLVTDSGKLKVLDDLLNTLKEHGHRVLIYSQMTRMIDLLEEYMWHRKHTYMRLDGSSKISDRRDMVADFQTRSDIFVFLLSTRAGGLGINLTAADTVIFYDSDWNPTVDQQAMDRAHRLGQTKQVTVYRLVCKGSIEERILQRAREKSEIQRMVISGGNFKPDTLKPKEVVSLLLDDDELEKKFRLRQEERKQMEKINQDRKRKMEPFGESKRGRKKRKEDNYTSSLPLGSQDADSIPSIDSIPPSPYSEHSVSSSLAVAHDDTSSEGPLIVDDGSPSTTPVPFSMQLFGKSNNDTSNSTLSTSPFLKKRGTGRGRGRPRGSGRRGNGRGRGNMLATAAAELAGAQAGKSAAFAAYGYSLGSGKSNSSVGKSAILRGQRTSLRGSSSLTTKCLSSRGRSSYKGISKNLPTKSISLGFYMPGPQL